MAPRVVTVTVSSAALTAVLLASTSALAVPPLHPFPAATSPAADGALAANGHVLIFGSDAVSLDGVGVALSVDNAPVSITTGLVGCCTVEIVPEADIAVGAAVSLLVSSGGTDSTFAFTGADPDVTAPSLGVPEIVQVVATTALVAPMTPRDGPAWIITLDVPGVDGAAALATYDDDGALLTIEPTTGALFERLITGAAGDRTRACITVEARSVSGTATRADAVCTDLPAPREDPPGAHDPRGGDPGGCSSLSLSSSSLSSSSSHSSSSQASSSPSSPTSLLAPLSLAAALALLTRARRRRATHRASTLTRAAALHGPIACALLISGCAGRALDAGDSGRVCADAFADHSYPGAALSDRFFDEQARPDYGWLAVKGLILDPQDPERRRVGFLDDDFYHLHDEWFYFRLMNGVQPCGGEEITPLEGATFADVDAVKEWAHEQDRLPPFLSWTGERLYAPDFYRLSRATEPRVYAPFYLTRDVENEPRAYAMRVAGPDVLDRENLAAIFDALDPLMPAGAALYWKPALRRPAQHDFAEELQSTHDPLGDRVRWR